MNNPATPRIPVRHRWLNARTRADFADVTALSKLIGENDPEVQRALGRLYEEQGLHSEAIVQWQALHHNCPADFEACFHVAMAEIRTGAGINEALAIIEHETVTPAFKMHLSAVLASPPELPPNRAFRHISICGVSFCGSTLMDRLLGGLPEVRSIGESHWLTKGRKASGYVPMEFINEQPMTMPYCTICGNKCDVLNFEFRRGLAADHTRWYQRIAHRLNTDILISADKNAPKLVDNDPLMQFDALVMFKSPVQAWISHRDKLAQDKDAGFYDAECLRYANTWTRAYRGFLDQFQPMGKVIYFSFEDFVQRPESSFEALCKALNLTFNPAVLQETYPGHAIGGNARAIAKLRSANYKVDISSLPLDNVTPEQHAIIANSPGLMETHQQLLSAYKQIIG